MAKNGSTIEDQAAAVHRAYVDLMGTRNRVEGRVRAKKGTEAELREWDRWLPHLEDAVESLNKAVAKKREREAEEARKQAETQDLEVA